ncbi:helix-turn-helix domain-containing protein [Dorea phocaeensis]|uniref:helix-turn-helix domain-containing protein n=1 Tax=Dorea phocaeensis TaxID=2040291 RepID=UPI000C7880B1|nr:helix-turn-helix domain-containing protein [Dorea phocaeensis]
MHKPTLEGKDFLTVIETAEFFGLSRRKLFRLVEEKNLPFMAMYGTRKLIIKDEFIKYLQKPGVKEGLANGKPRTKKRF